MHSTTTSTRRVRTAVGAVLSAAALTGLGLAAAAPAAALPTASVVAPAAAPASDPVVVPPTIPVPFPGRCVILPPFPAPICIG